MAVKISTELPIAASDPDRVVGLENVAKDCGIVWKQGINRELTKLNYNRIERIRQFNHSVDKHLSDIV